MLDLISLLIKIQSESIQIVLEHQSHSGPLGILYALIFPFLSWPFLFNRKSSIIIAADESTISWGPSPTFGELVSDKTLVMAWSLQYWLHLKNGIMKLKGMLVILISELSIDCHLSFRDMETINPNPLPRPKRSGPWIASMLRR